MEIANVSDKPLVYPIVLNAGDVDPRSFGDLSDTLGLEGLSDRERVDRTFAFVLASSDYFMNHTAMFPPGSDAPRDVEYQALLMLNGYCGFECGPLNNMTANLFVDVAKCPAANTSGYGHSFEQVFYDGKNHIYDLSAQKYFPAADNETAAYLEEGGDEAGIFPRMGNAAEHYIRKSTRGVWPGNPASGAKIGVTLNPGEAFRVWQVNDGHCNDLVTRSKTGVYRGYASKFRPDYAEPCHADTEKMFLQRTERFFPQYLSGFITFDGAPSAANPAFEAAADGGAFCYKVASGGYPIVHAEYAAVRRDGSRAALEISTDGGKTFRPLASPADYAVRARYAYLVRVKAPIGDVARFTASTEVQLNPRVFPGRLRAGANRLTFTCASGGAARVTVQGRAPAGRIAVPEAVSSGAIVGAETLFYAFDPAERPVLDVEGASALATVKAFGGIRATLRDGKLALAADAAGGTRVGAVRIVDGGAEKTLVVLVGTGVRFGTARHACVADGARMLPPDATSPQARGWLPAGNHGAEIRGQPRRRDPLPDRPRAGGQVRGAVPQPLREPPQGRPQGTGAHALGRHEVDRPRQRAQLGVQLQEGELRPARRARQLQVGLRRPSRHEPSLREHARGGPAGRRPRVVPLLAQRRRGGDRGRAGGARSADGSPLRAHACPLWPQLRPLAHTGREVDHPF